MPFELFTEIDAWWRSGQHSFVDPGRAVGVRMEPGPGGRWLEVWDAATGSGYEQRSTDTRRPTVICS